MKTFSELVRRYEEIQGVPFAELADELGRPLPRDPKRAKERNISYAALRAR